MHYQYLQHEDPELFAAICSEAERQSSHLELIASENFVSSSVLEAQGSILTNKYAEGYPGKRYYGGCFAVDVAENLAIERAKKLFNANYVNVQPHSGAQANFAVQFALLNPGDKLLGMSLDQGGHLTHGMKLNVSGKYFSSHFYALDPQTECIDYDALRKQALELQPKVIVAGASAYPRELDFQRFSEIAKEVGAILWVDMAHIAGLVAAGIHQSPLPYADVVTTTTHKTLRGPRGGMILTNNESMSQKINKALFPGIQGGPLMHVIAAKAVAFKEALNEDFKEYQVQVVKNAKALAEALIAKGLKLVTNGTDNHLLLIDLRGTGVSGKLLQNRLDEVGLTANKNTVPYDDVSPFITSGLRLGTPAVTTRGLKESEMIQIADFVYDAIYNYDEKKESIKLEVDKICERFPLETSKITV